MKRLLFALLLSLGAIACGDGPTAGPSVNNTVQANPTAEATQGSTVSILDTAPKP